MRNHTKIATAFIEKYDVDKFHTGLQIDFDHGSQSSHSMQKMVQELSTFHPLIVRKILSKITAYNEMSRADHLINIKESANRFDISFTKRSTKALAYKIKGAERRAKREEKRAARQAKYAAKRARRKALAKKNRNKPVEKLSKKHNSLADLTGFQEFRYFFRAPLKVLISKLPKMNAFQQARAILILQSFRPNDYAKLQFNIDLTKGWALLDLFQEKHIILLNQGSDSPEAQEWVIAQMLLIKIVDEKGRKNPGDLKAVYYRGAVEIVGVAPHSKSPLPIFSVKISTGHLATNAMTWTSRREHPYDPHFSE